MKNILQNTIIILITIFITNSTYSQRVYINVGTGVGFSLNGNVIGTSSTEYTYEVDTNYSNSTYKNYKMSLGSGNMPTIGIGYQINKQWAFELNTFYLIGKPEEINMKTSYKAGGFRNSYEQTLNYRGNSFMFNPAFVYKSNRKKDLEFYTKFGLLIGTTKIHLNNNISANEGTTGGYHPFYNIEYNWEYTGGISFGTQCGLGMEYVFIDNIHLFAEVNYVSYSTKPKKGNLISYV